MVKIIKITAHIFRWTPLHPFFRRLMNKASLHRAEKRWARTGRTGAPPSPIKHEILRKYLRKYGLNVLVETGTYRGETVEAMRWDVAKVYSIELSVQLYQDALRRFKSAKNVELIQGDSGAELEAVVKKIQGPALFWLDGHYSGGVTAKGEKETPVLEELRHIFDHNNRSVILIDDADCFNGSPDSGYPSLENLIVFVKSNYKEVDVSVADNIIRIVPSKK